MMSSDLILHMAFWMSQQKALKSDDKVVMGTESV